MLFKMFYRTHSHVLFWGHWYPCFGFRLTYSLGYKARLGSALFAFVEANVMYTHSLRSPSGATPADLLTVGRVAILPYIHEGNRLRRRHTRYRCSYFLISSEISHGLVFIFDNNEKYHRSSNNNLFYHLNNFLYNFNGI